MGEKDITEKTLEDYADVFADIVNVLLFDGEQRVLPEDLVDTRARSQFKSDDGVLHEQERDVVKHVDAFLKMMKAVTGDHRYEEVRKTVRKGERITMCEVLDYREKRGIERDRRALNRLNDLLLEEGRIEDLKRSTKDSDFQQKLLDEYGLTV